MKICKVCNHAMSKHKHILHDPDGKPMEGKPLCLEPVGDGPFGMSISCSCDGKRAAGLEIVNSNKEVKYHG